MNMIRIGYVTAATIGLLWAAVVAVVVAIALALTTGAAVTPGLLAAMPAGAVAGVGLVTVTGLSRGRALLVAAVFGLLLAGLRAGLPFGLAWAVSPVAQATGLLVLALGVALPLHKMLAACRLAPLHDTSSRPRSSGF